MMMSRIGRVAVALTFSASLATAQAPAKAPPAGPVKPAAIPDFQEATLGNGLRLLLVQSKRQPIVSLALMLNAGSAYDPAGKEGLASLVAATMTKGAGSRSADELSAAIEGVGGAIGVGSSPDFMTVSAAVLSDNAPLAFELVGDAVSRPAFASKEVELARTQALSGLQLELAQPAALASRYFNAELFGAHPYGRHASTTSVRSLTIDDMRAFQKSHVVPSGALLVIAGDITLARARELAQKSFGSWTGNAPAMAARPAPPVRSRTEILLVNRPGSVQSDIVVGNLTFKPTDQSYYALSVANRMLGGGSDSRLFKTLREQRSWTYDAHSSATRFHDIGVISAGTEVRNAVTDSALIELLAIETTLGTQPAPSAEVDAAKSGLVGSLPLQLETAQGIAEQVGLYAMLGLPKTFIRTLRPNLAAVTGAQVEAASKRFIRSDKALVVVVGDGAQIYDKLARIAPTRIVNVQGDRMTAADLVPKATALPVDISKLLPGTDSFTVLVQGNVFGYQKSAVRKTASGFEYETTLQLGPAISQNSVTSFGADLTPISSKATGKVNGQDASTDIAYRNGRAKGFTRTPGPTGIANVNVDTTIAPGTLDDNQLLALIPGLAWSPTAKFTAQVFDATQGRLRQTSLNVAGTESITVPAGTFSVYRIDMTGGPQPVTLFVSTAAPYRLVKFQFAGAPVEFVLVK